MQGFLGQTHFPILDGASLSDIRECCNPNDYEKFLRAIDRILGDAFDPPAERTIRLADVCPPARNDRLFGRSVFVASRRSA